MPTPINPYDHPDEHNIFAYLNGVAHCSCGYCWRIPRDPNEADIPCHRIADPTLRSSASNQISAILINDELVWENPKDRQWRARLRHRKSRLRH